MLADGRLILDAVSDNDDAQQQPTSSTGPPPQFGRRHVVVALDAFFGVARQGAADVFHLWPEHVPALRAWNELSGQWRVGPAGAAGLDYAGVEAYFRLVGLRGAARRERFDELRIMERATLRAWAARRGQRP